MLIVLCYGLTFSDLRLHDRLDFGFAKSAPLGLHAKTRVVLAKSGLPAPATVPGLKGTAQAWSVAARAERNADTAIMSRIPECLYLVLGADAS